MTIAGWRWSGPVAVLALTALGLGLRLYRLDGRSLWLDEILTSQPAHLATPSDVVAWSQAAINQMPLFYEVIWFVGHWGDDAVLLRLPAVIAGTLLVPAVYLCAGTLFGRGVGLLASLLTAVMPFTVWFSQEARNYSLLMLLTTMQMYCAYVAVKRGRGIAWVGLAVFTVLNLYTHYLALLATAAVAFYIGACIARDVAGAMNRVARIVTAACLVALVVVAAIVPWRTTSRSLYHDSADLLRTIESHRLTGLLAVALLIIALAGSWMLLRRVSRQVRAGAAAVAFAALVVVMVFTQPWAVGAGAQNSIAAAALAILAAAFAVSALHLLLDLLREQPEAARRLVAAVAAGLAVGAAYAPWLPSLRVFLSRPDQALGVIYLGHSPTLGDIAAVFGGLDLSGLLLLGLAAGVITLVVWTVRQRALEAGPLLCWIFVPLGALLYSARASIVGIDVRYFSFIYPALIIAIACGAAGVIAGVTTLARRLPRATPVRMRPAAAATGVLVVGLLLLQAVPALATSYQLPKQDYRSAAEYIARAGAPNGVVIALGNYSDWSVICFGYYLRQMHSSVSVVDGLQIDSRISGRLQQGGPVLGVVIFPSASQLALLDDAQLVNSDFVDVTGVIHVVRVPDIGRPALDQARDLLRWETPLEPALSGSARLLDLAAGMARLGDNLVPAGNPAITPGWSLARGATSDGDVLTLSPGGSIQAGAQVWVPIAAGTDYLVQVDYRQAVPDDMQKLYAVALDAHGRALAAFPGPSGYDCSSSQDWVHAYFAFTAPSDSAVVELQFRAAGTGSAQFRAIEVSTISEIA